MSRLPPRLAWRRWLVPAGNHPLNEYERYLLARAWFAMQDEDGTRRVATEEEAAEMLAAADGKGRAE